MKRCSNAALVLLIATFAAVSSPVALLTHSSVVAFPRLDSSFHSAAR